MDYVRPDKKLKKKKKKNDQLAGLLYNLTNKKVVCTLFTGGNHLFLHFNIFFYHKQG